MKKFNFRKVQKQPSRGVLIKRCSKICSKFTGEHPCQSVISIKLQSNFFEITLRYGCSPVNLLHICRTPFSRNTSGWLLLYFLKKSKIKYCKFNFVCTILSKKRVVVKTENYLVNIKTETKSFVWLSFVLYSNIKAVGFFGRQVF